VAERLIAAGGGVDEAGPGGSFADVRACELPDGGTGWVVRLRDPDAALAGLDPLTGLPNRRAFDARLADEVARAHRTGRPLSLVLLDLDRFKRINDQHGHDTGDQVLASVGEAINHAVRASDFPGRAGGEEFLVVLPDTTTDGAVVLAEKLRASIRTIEVAGLERPVSASFGVATFPIDAADTDSLLRIADRALYLAKHNGRDRVETAPVEEDRVSSDLDAGHPR
jgi:diguanylate cyclase (GGDEF)-like protein